MWKHDLHVPEGLFRWKLPPVRLIRNSVDHMILKGVYHAVVASHRDSGLSKRSFTLTMNYSELVIHKPLRYWVEIGS